MGVICSLSVYGLGTSPPTGRGSTQTYSYSECDDLIVQLTNSVVWSALNYDRRIR
jgi:hypothetical protein